MTKIEYRGEKGFYLLENWPEYPDYCSHYCDHERKCSRCELLGRDYNKAIEQCRANGVRIANPELCHTGGTHGLLFTLDGKQIKDGDTFDFPENLRYEKKVIVDMLQTVAILSKVESQESVAGTENEKTSLSIAVSQIVDKYLPQIFRTATESYFLREQERMTMHREICMLSEPHEQESQEEIWEDVEQSFINWEDRYVNTTELSKKYKITRK